MSLALPNLVLLVTATLFVACAVHSVFYVGVKRETWLYWTLLTLFFGAMCGACLTENLAGMWVAIEATTLLSAPLICHHKSAESVEAMWKYLLICSVGIGLALFGTLLVFAGWHLPGFIFVLAETVKFLIGKDFNALSRDNCRLFLYLRLFCDRLFRCFIILRCRQSLFNLCALHRLRLILRKSLSRQH